jgi:glycosyltransferase involved in cell wall biosynthesis
MRIAVDARWIFNEISGVGAYTRALIRHLARLDQENEYVLLFNDATLRDRTLREAQIVDAANMLAVDVPCGIFSPRGQFILPGLLRKHGVNIYHSTNYMIPLLAFPKNKQGAITCVVTIHDVIPLLFPEHAPKSKKSRVFPVYRRLMKEIGARADAIITDSKTSAVDVARTLEIPTQNRAKIQHVYCGVAEHFRPNDSRSARSKNDRRQVLFVGRTDPYKNLVHLVEVLAEVIPMLPFPLALTVAGSPDPRYPEAKQVVERLGIGDRVRWTGYITDDALAELYREADVLVHPSRYEGFGLQVAEAMASGLPVICSNAGSLPEVAGDATLIVDPDDSDGLKRDIMRVLTEPGLAASLAAKGLERSKQFTWDKTARETLKIYENVGK